MLFLAPFEDKGRAFKQNKKELNNNGGSIERNKFNYILYVSCFFPNGFIFDNQLEELELEEGDSLEKEIQFSLVEVSKCEKLLTILLVLQYRHHCLMNFLQPIYPMVHPNLFRSSYLPVAIVQLIFYGIQVCVELACFVHVFEQQFS